MTELRCNTGLPDPVEISQTMFGMPATSTTATVTASAPMTDDDLLKMIQADLHTLGYETRQSERCGWTAVPSSRFPASRRRRIWR